MPAPIITAVLLLPIYYFSGATNKILVKDGQKTDLFPRYEKQK
jgi:hypothetical protein